MSGALLSLFGHSPAGPPPPPPSNLFPDPLIEDASDSTDGWTLIGTTDAMPGLLFNVADSSSSAGLVGTNSTTFDSAIADNTLYHVAITITGYLGLGENRTINVFFKGTSQSYTFTQDDTVAHDITTATGDSGFIINGDDTELANFIVSLIEVTA